MEYFPIDPTIMDFREEDEVHDYDPYKMQQGVYPANDEYVYHLGPDDLRSKSSAFKPPPPSVATSSYIKAPVRRTFIQRSNWGGTTRPRYDASGKLEALWGTVNDITVLGKYKGAVVKGDKDYKSVVQRIKDAWLHGQKETMRVGGGYEYREPTFGEAAGRSKDAKDYKENLRRKDEERKLDEAAFALWITSPEAQVVMDMQLQDDEVEDAPQFVPLDYISPESWTSQDEKSLMEQARSVWRNLSKKKRERYRSRALICCGGFSKQLLADRVLTKIIEAEKEIDQDMKMHLPQDQAVASRNRKNMFRNKAASAIQAFWRGVSLRITYEHLWKMEFAALGVHVEDDNTGPAKNEAKRNAMNHIMKKRASSIGKRRRGNDTSKRNRRDMFVGIPGAECDELGTRKEMSALRAKLKERFDFFLCRLWGAAYVIRAELVHQGASFLDFAAMLRRCPSHGKDGRISKQDAIRGLTSMCPSLREDQANLLCSYLDFGANSFVLVNDVTRLVRGALTDRRMLLSNFLFDMMAKTISNDGSLQRTNSTEFQTRLERLRWFFRTFYPEGARNGLPEQLDVKYKDSVKVNKKLFTSLYRQYAPSRQPPSHLWDSTTRFAARDSKRRVDAVELSEMFKRYLGDDGSVFDEPEVAQNGDDKEGIKGIMNRLDRLVVRSSSAQGQGLTRVDWISLMAEVSAVYSETRLYESALLSACAVDATLWRRHAEVYARKAMGHPDLQAAAFEEAEEEKMCELKNALGPKAFARYEMKLTNALRKIGSSLLSCAGANLTVAGLKKYMCKMPSFGTDRKVSARDLSTCLASYGIPLSKEGLALVSNHFDSNNSGFVSVDGFIEGVKAKIAETALAQRTATEIKGSTHGARVQKKWLRLVMKNMIPENEKQWQMYTHTDGRPYWFCPLTGERRWERPLSVARREVQSKREELHRGRLWALESIAQLKEEVAAAIADHTSKLSDEHVLPLGSLGLQLLPQSIGQQRQVEALFLSRNAIKRLPEGVLHLHCLTHLFLDHNSLTSLPENFETLSGLKLLDVSRNKLKMLPKDFGSHLKNLAVLKCDYNHMEELPVSMQGMRFLKVLSVTHNKLARLFEHTVPKLDDDDDEEEEDVEDEVERSDRTGIHLENLEHLILYGNNMRELPRELFVNSPELRVVDVHDNILSFVPPEVCKCKNLRELHLNGNQLTSLANDWDFAPLLECISLQYNKLYKLPGTLCSLRALRTLSVSNNKLTELPEHIDKLVSLETLHVHCNHLKRLPGSIALLPKLAVLTVHMNSLNKLPALLPKSLRILKAHSNDIAKISSGVFDDCGALEKLDLAKNRISVLPESFKELSSLSYLRLDGNPLDTKLKKVAEAASFKSSDERSFGFILRKLVDGLTMADMQARIDVAHNVSIEEALDIQRKQVKERREGTEIIPLRPDQCAEVIMSSMSKFALPEDPSFIAESRFRDCLSVIGILLNHDDIAKLTKACAKLFGRRKRGVIEYEKFVRSIWQPRKKSRFPKWYDVVIGKLVAGISMADIKQRVEVAMYDSVDAALDVGLRRSSDFIVQALENCFARYTSPANPERITEENFKECIRVIGILLSNQEMEEIKLRVSEEYGRGGLIEYKKFVRSLRDKRFASGGAGAYARKKYENIAAAVVRMHSAPKKVTVKKVGKSASAKYAPIDLVDRNNAEAQDVKRLAGEAKRTADEVKELRKSLEDVRKKAEIYQYYNKKVAGGSSYLLLRERILDRGKSLMKQTRPATAGACMKRGSSKTRDEADRWALMETRERLNAQKRDLRKKIREERQVAKKLKDELHTLSAEASAFGDHMVETWIKSRKELQEVAKGREKRHEMAKKVDRTAVWRVFDKHANPESAYATRKIRQGKLIAAFSELYRVIGHGRKGLTEIEWRAMLLSTVQQAMESGYRDLNGKYVAFDKDDEGMLDFNGFLFLCAVLRDRFDADDTNVSAAKESQSAKRPAKNASEPAEVAQYVVITSSGEGMKPFRIPLSQRVGGGFAHRQAQVTASQLKTSIERKLGIPRELQKLLLKGGEELADVQTLMEAGVRSGDKIELVVVSGRYDI